MNSIDEVLQRLSTYEAKPGVPVLTVYLNTEADDRGRDHFEPFLRKGLAEAVDGFEDGSAARKAADADCARVLDYIQWELKPETNTLVLFCSQEGGLFEALQLEAKGAENRTFAAWRPQVYPLLKLRSATPRSAIVHLDRRSARIIVVGVDGVTDSEEHRGERISRTSVGGWSQARYQRHVSEITAAHLKEVAAQLADVVKTDGVEHIVLAGDDRIVQQFQETLTHELQERTVDTMRAQSDAREHELVADAREILEAHGARTEEALVQELRDAAASGGLGVTGQKATHQALRRGQVRELVIGPALHAERPGQAEAFARMAIETGAKVSFVGSTGLLESAGGVGALLRY